MQPIIISLIVVTDRSVAAVTDHAFSAVKRASWQVGNCGISECRLQSVLLLPPVIGRNGTRVLQLPVRILQDRPAVHHVQCYIQDPNASAQVK